MVVVQTIITVILSTLVWKVLCSSSLVLVVYLQNVGDSGLSSQDQTWVRLDICIFCCFKPWGELPVLSPESNVQGERGRKRRIGETEGGGIGVVVVMC